MTEDEFEGVVVSAGFDSLDDARRTADVAHRTLEAYAAEYGSGTGALPAGLDELVVRHREAEADITDAESSGDLRRFDRAVFERSELEQQLYEAMQAREEGTRMSEDREPDVEARVSSLYAELLEPDQPRADELEETILRVLHGADVNVQGRQSALRWAETAYRARHLERVRDGVEDIPENVRVAHELARLRIQKLPEDAKEELGHAQVYDLLETPHPVILGAREMTERGEGAQRIMGAALAAGMDPKTAFDVGTAAEAGVL